MDAKRSRLDEIVGEENVAPAFRAEAKRIAERAFLHGVQRHQGMSVGYNAIWCGDVQPAPAEEKAKRCNECGHEPHAGKVCAVVDECKGVWGEDGWSPWRRTCVCYAPAEEKLPLRASCYTTGCWCHRAKKFDAPVSHGEQREGGERRKGLECPWKSEMYGPHFSMATATHAFSSLQFDRRSGKDRRKRRTANVSPDNRKRA